MSDSQHEGLQHFVSKWIAREPEMQFAEVFASAAEKKPFPIWGALLHELKHTLFELSDANVTRIKTAWWADEFLRLAAGQPRHPLTQALADISAPWAAISSTLSTVVESASDRSSDTAQAMTALIPFAGAITQVEDHVFNAKSSSPPELFAVHCLLQRLPHGLASEDMARIPMHLMARHSLNAAQLPDAGNTGLLQDWAQELRAQLEHKVAGSVFRRTRTRFDQARLDTLVAGKGFVKVSAPGHLWRAWRAAVMQPR